MMSYSIENTITSLEEQFNSIRFDYRNVDFGSTIPVFFIYLEDEKLLEEKWERIANLIAVDFQARQRDEYQVWNIYLFYIIDNQISKELKYKIENDTFSSRKIVIENTKNQDLMIDNHILNDINICLENDKNPTNSFDSNQIIESILEDKILKKTNITKEAITAYEELIIALKQIEDEI